MKRPNDWYACQEQWEYVQHTRQAIRARATLLWYTLLVSLPFVALVACGACLGGLLPHEITGITCYHAMLTLIYVFDSLRSAAHAAFAAACQEGLVDVKDGMPIIDPACPHRRLARLSFAIGSHPWNGEER